MAAGLGYDGASPGRFGTLGPFSPSNRATGFPVHGPFASPPLIGWRPSFSLSAVCSSGCRSFRRVLRMRSPIARFCLFVGRARARGHILWPRPSEEAAERHPLILHQQYKSVIRVTTCCSNLELTQRIAKEGWFSPGLNISDPQTLFLAVDQDDFVKPISFQRYCRVQLETHQMVKTDFPRYLF